MTKFLRYPEIDSTASPLKPFIVGFVCVLLTGISYGFGLYLFPMVMPEILSDLGLDYSDSGIITAISQVSPLLVIPFVGYITSRMGALRLIIYSQVIGACVLLFLSQVQSFWGLMLLVFLLRGWSVIVWIPLVEIAADYIDFKWHATLFTIASAGGCLFVFIDGVLSSYYLENYHWRDLWLVVASGSFLSAGISWVALKWVNAWCFQPIEQRGVKRNYDDVLTWVKTKNGCIICIIFGLIGLSFMPFQTYLAAYLRDNLHIGLSTIGLMWTVLGISGVIGGVIIGIMTDRFSVKIALMLVFFMAAVAAIFICIPVNETNIYAMAILFGIGQASIYGLGPAFISKTLPAQLATRIFSLGTIVLVIASFFGNLGGGWLSENLGSFRLFYCLLGILFMIGFILSILLGKEARKGLENIVS